MMKDLETLFNDCCEQLAVGKLTIAFAESATAGKLAYEFLKTAFSGQILKGGLVLLQRLPQRGYSVHRKGIDRNLYTRIRRDHPGDGAETKKNHRSDVIVSVAGLTTEGGSERPGKPVGIMFYCVYFKGETNDRKKIFTGSPEEIVNLTIEQVAKTILSVI